MNGNMTLIMQFATVVSPIVVALVQLLKSTVNLPKNILPLLSLLVGVGVGALAVPFTDLDLVMRLWAGGFAGMSAVGFYEVTLSYRSGYTKYDPALKAKWQQAEEPALLPEGTGKRVPVPPLPVKPIEAQAEGKETEAPETLS